MGRGWLPAGSSYEMLCGLQIELRYCERWLMTACRTHINLHPHQSAGRDRRQSTCVLDETEYLFLKPNGVPLWPILEYTQSFRQWQRVPGAEARVAVFHQVEGSSLYGGTIKDR